jgi:hypothetical protein
MATPTYNGSGQPTVNSGWLGGLGSWFGVQAPAYAGAGQIATASSGYFSGTTPAYKQAPSSQNAAPSCTPDRITLVVPREVIPQLIDPQQ